MGEMNQPADAAPLPWDMRAFEVFYDAYAPLVYRYVYFRTGMDHNAAVELTNDVFLAAWRDRSLFAVEPQRVLLGIAWRKLVDHYRRRGRNRERAFTDLPAAEQLWLEHVAADADGKPIPPKSETGSEDAREFIGVALTSLEPADQQLLLDKYVKQKSIAELAATLSRTASAVMSSLARARERLRTALKREMTAEKAHERLG